MVKEFDYDSQELKKDLLQNFQTQLSQKPRTLGAQKGWLRSNPREALTLFPVCKVDIGFGVSGLWSDAKRITVVETQQMADWSDWADGIHPLM